MGWVLGHRDLTGSIAAAEVNTVIDCLAELSTTHQLPQKLLVLHQFRLSMLRDQQQIRTDRPQVAVLIHMDGQGTPALKHETWAAVVQAAGPGTPLGWKNFCVSRGPRGGCPGPAAIAGAGSGLHGKGKAPHWLIGGNSGTPLVASSSFLSVEDDLQAATTSSGTG